MKTITRFLFWCILFLALTLVFYLFSPTAAAAFSDRDTTVSLLTDDGIETLSMAEYLPGAVAAEMPVSFAPEALKAQAVAARTYVLSSDSHEKADVCTDGGCCISYMNEQELRDFWGEDFEKNYNAVADAVSATDGEYLSYDGQAIQAVFHASSSGVTEDSGALWSPQPYLTSVDSPEDAQSVPNFITTATASAEEFSELLELEKKSPDPSKWVEATRYEDSGRVRAVCICGKAFTGAYLRSVFALRSTDFSLIWNGSDFVFTVSGNGHGVGMSQYGANLLAADGWSYAEILAHYYPGTELVSPAV